MILSQYSPEIQLARQIWLDHLNNSESIFFKECRSERILNFHHPKLRKDKTLKLLKLIKLEALKLLNDDNRFGVYVGLQYWAEQLKTDKSAVSKMLHRLESLEVIQRIPVSLQSKTKASRRKLLIVPHVNCDQATDVVTKQQLELGQIQLKLSNGQLDNEHKSHASSNSYTPHFRILIQDSNNQDSNNQDHSLKDTSYLYKENVSNETCASDTSHILLANKKGTFTRYQLKEKQRHMTDKDYNLCLNDFLPHIEYHQTLIRFLRNLIKYDVLPKPNETRMIIDHWNAHDNSQFARIKTTSSKVYYEIQMLVTYRIHFDMLSVDDIMMGIDLFDELSGMSRFLKYAKGKLGLKLFLSGTKSQYLPSSWFDICQMDKSEAMNIAACGPTIKYPTTLKERVKPHFVNTFYRHKEDTGMQIINDNLSKFIRFTNAVVAFHKTHETCGMSIDKYVEKLFAFIYKRTSNMSPALSTAQIIHPKWIAEFVRYQSNEPGWEKFGNRKPEKAKMTADESTQSKDLTSDK